MKNKLLILLIFIFTNCTTVTKYEYKKSNCYDKYLEYKEKLQEQIKEKQNNNSQILQNKTSIQKANFNKYHNDCDKFFKYL